MSRKKQSWAGAAPAAKQKPRVAANPRVMAEIESRIDDALSNATREEFEVLTLLMDTKTKLTQRDIARQCPTLGAHWRELAADAADRQRNDTTLRKVRQVIRDLRIKHRVPIMSDTGGYWLPCSQDEVETFVSKLKRQAPSTASAWYETLFAVKDFVADTKHQKFFGAVANLASLNDEEEDVDADA